MLYYPARTFLLHRGFLLSPGSNDREIKELLADLAPYKTDKELIRIGGDADGGYLIPNDLQGIQYCFSPGVAEKSTFESDLASRGISSFLADYSVDEPPIKSDMFHFTKKHLGAVNNDKFMTLQEWIESSVSTNAKDFILQMDIEGREYEVILDTPTSVWERFRIVVIEFHDLQDIFSESGIKFIGHCFLKLLSSFRVVHIHPNNTLPMASSRNGLEVPSIMEITFLRRDRVRASQRSELFPHPLDQPNCADAPDMVLPACWYSR